MRPPCLFGSVWRRKTRPASWTLPMRFSLSFSSSSTCTSPSTRWVSLFAFCLLLSSPLSSISARAGQAEDVAAILALLRDIAPDGYAWFTYPYDEESLESLSVILASYLAMAEDNHGQLTWSPGQTLGQIGFRIDDILSRMPPNSLPFLSNRLDRIVSTLGDDDSATVMGYLYDILRQTSLTQDSVSAIHGIESFEHDGIEDAKRVVLVGDALSDLGAIANSGEIEFEILEDGFESLAADLAELKTLLISQWSTNPPPGAPTFDHPSPEDHSEEMDDARSRAYDDLSTTEGEMSSFVQDDDNWLPDWEWTTWLPGSDQPVRNAQPRENISSMSTHDSAIYITDAPIQSTVVSSARIPMVVLSSDHQVWTKNLSAMNSFAPIMQGVWLLSAAVGVFLMIRREWDYYVSLGHPSFSTWESYGNVDSNGVETLSEVQMLHVE